MREHAEAYAKSIAVKREQNQREASRAAAHADESKVARTDTRGSSKMPQESDPEQFLEDTASAMQQSLLSKASADRKYESNIKMLNA